MGDTVPIVRSYLVMMLDAHADGVDKNSDHNTPAEVLALHDAPKFFSHLSPHVYQIPEACPPLPLHHLLPPLLQVVLLLPCFFYSILLNFFAFGRVSRGVCSISW